MRAIIIPEGVQHDHLILKPIFEAMFRHLGKNRARIDVHSPHVRGVDAVRSSESIRGVIAEFPIADLFVLCVDRDGDPHRREALDDLERKVSKILPAPRLFLAEHAWQEVEVWALAGTNWRLKPKWTWDEIRNERDAKEAYFEPIARDRHLFHLPGQGRKELGREAGRNYAKVRQNCPEIRDLEDRIRQWIKATAQR